MAVLALVLAGTSGCTPTQPPPERDPAAAAPRPPDASVDPDDPVRIKGLAPRLLLHRKRDGRVEQLHDGAAARAGDLIQMSYIAAGHRHGVVISLDGTGLVTLHHPARPEAQPTLVSRGQHALDHAYELDDAQPYERFVLVTSGDEPLPPSTVIAAAQSLAQDGPTARHSPLPLPERWPQSSILLRKVP